MDSSTAIHSKWITNQKPPRIQTLDEARPRTLKQHAAAEHIKQRLALSIGTQRTGESERVRAVKEEAQLRLLLALLQCPDAEVWSLVFAHKSQHLYDPTRHYPRDVLGDNRSLCAKARELVELWMGPFDTDVENMKEMSLTRWLESEGQFPEVIINRGYRCVFTHSTGLVETAHVIPDHIAELNDVGYPEQMEAFTTLLSYFFPTKMDDDEAIEELVYELGKPNIIPLQVSFHAGWDRFHLILRPISTDQDDDGSAMKLQFLQLNERDPAFTDSIYDDPGVNSQLADWWPRSGVAENPPLFIDSGDIYELRAEGPDERPLPSRMLLDIACRMHQLRHAFKAKDALRSLFREPPPDVAEDVVRERYKQEPTSGFWEGIIEAAMEDCVLSSEDGWKWIVAMEQLDREDEEN
ncbi:hypothetical protein PG996_004921 [Apiospora saccharicola]|uniref:HNH nuclease domain-containing protein n=1 Tax=Apiospora saccharicola TaxID=335842 RepID=A0ABR1VK40_9PEZI